MKTFKVEKRLILGLLLLLQQVVCLAQVGPSFEQCPKGRESCGPEEKIGDRIQLSGAALQPAPYSYILHQEIRRFSTNYSTGSFIAPDMLLTAHHNVYKPKWIKRLSFCNKAVDGERWISFKRKEVDIILLGSVAAPTDMAIIRFKDPEKVKPLYRGHFEIGDIDSFADTAMIHLSGFPCNLPDILVDKSARKDSLMFREHYSLIGYYIYTCTGDSGAPLWTIKNGQPVLVGIHHGGGEHYFPQNWNCAARVTRDVMVWVNGHR